jgi:hypothetical protein
MEPPTITPLAKYIDVDSTGRVSEAPKSFTKIIVHAKSSSKQPSFKEVLLSLSFIKGLTLNLMV